MILTMAGADSVAVYADTLTGDFMLSSLPVGDYDLEFTPTAGAYGDSIIFSVPVVAGQGTDIGTVELQ